MENISYSMEGRRCNIHVGSDILSNAGGLLSECGQRFALLTNPTIRSLYADAVAKSLDEADLSHEIFEIADSETAKSLDRAGAIYSALSAAGFDRDSCVIGLGGGVVGDLAGFVAATYMRGIGIVHIPTTLMAQIDSAIGGKTGVNIPEGKNLVGAFHQPSMVLSDILTLKTLPEEHYASGLAEAVKYGMACDRELFSFLEDEADAILRRDEEILEKLVMRCSAIKAGIVELDARDRGRRMVLNFGHTLGHALEAASGFAGYSHGEAVALGMLFAAEVSVQSGRLDREGAHRLGALLSAFGLPTRAEMDVDSVMNFMRADKKGMAGKPRLVLATCIGAAATFDSTDDKLIRAILEGMGT